MNKNWLNHYQLVLLDFDGLLVNTEEIHYQAYQLMCSRRGYNLDWSFPRYCSIAHYESEGLKEQLYAHIPDLYAVEPDWKVLYNEKKQAFIDLVNSNSVQMMPGAVSFLEAIFTSNVKSCIVTHSSESLISHIRKQHPILNKVPRWFTRESYNHPKPHPDGYLTAIRQLAQENDRIIGFEDTPRGIKALLGTKAIPVLVCSIAYPEIKDFKKQGVLHYPSLELLISG